jgi:(p)ppGpp synthase/HD superfamily hydrolase
MRLSPRFQEAFSYAATLHADQQRKASGEPYLAHLLAVAAIVMEYGGSEEEAIAALLHDAVEDQGGAATLTEIRRRFGPTVAEIVDGCSDTAERPKPPWRQRKEAYIARLRGAPGSVRLVSAADKLHNASSIVREQRRQGEAVWRHFRGGRDGTLWYYRAVVETLRQTGSNPLVEELDRVVTELEQTVRQDEACRGDVEG